MSLNTRRKHVQEASLYRRYVLPRCSLQRDGDCHAICLSDLGSTPSYSRSTRTDSAPTPHRLALRPSGPHPPAGRLVRLSLPPNRLRLRQPRVPPLQRHPKPRRPPYRPLALASSPPSA